MRDDFAEAVEMYATKSGVPEEKVLEAISKALFSAYKKITKHENLEVILDNNRKSLQIFSKKIVMDNVTNKITEISPDEAKKIRKEAEIGSEILVEIDPAEMGRIAAQISQQIIFENIKNVERDMLYHEYKAKEATIISGLFQRRTKRDDIIVDLKNVEGLLPIERQLPKDRIKIGMKVKVYIKNVELAKNHIKIILSRTDPDFVKKLFSLEVPEIANEIVMIKGIARDPGERSKIAVYCDQNDIDPVGSCVGMKGVRIQSIIRELDGEKIDIVKWDEDIEKYLHNLLSPIKILNIKLNYDEKIAIVVVPPDQLSSAIGKDGKNVRLAAVLLGWTIDIKSETDFEKLLQAEESRKMLKELFQEPSAKSDKKTEKAKTRKTKETAKEEAKRLLEPETGPVSQEEEIEEISIDELPDIPHTIMKKLKESGYYTIESIIELDINDLLKIPGIGKKNAELIIKSIEENVKVIEEEE